jgi:hypothetical protein
MAKYTPSDLADLLDYWPETKGARCLQCHTLLTREEVTEAFFRGCIALRAGEGAVTVLDVLYTCAACGTASYQRFTH